MDYKSLTIIDPELNKHYVNRKCIEINEASRNINKLKLFYLIVMAFQFMTRTQMSTLRPLVLCISCLLNYFAVLAFERAP